MRLEELDKGVVTPAGPGDAVGGVQPRWVARPQSSEGVSAVLAAAHQEGLAVIPRGAGTTLAWGAPPERFDVALDLTGLTGVVEHRAGDLVAVVRAGTALVDLQEQLGGSGQRLAIDGQQGRATLGGLVAQGLSGPSRLGFGTLRDLLIGATFVRPDGVVAHSGGTVVKNVAGYDLCKLLHGSAGTLAVLTELVFRLHPRPEASRWVTLPPAGGEEAAAAVLAVIHSQLVPAAVELDRSAGGPITVSVLLEGREATVTSRAEAVARLVGSGAVVGDRPPEWWGYRPAGPGPAIRVTAAATAAPAAATAATAAPTAAATAGSEAVLARLTTEVASLPRLLASLDAATAATGLAVDLRGSAGVGSFLAAIRAGTAGGRDGAMEPSCLAELVGRLRADSGHWGGTVVLLDGPVGSVDRWGPVAGIDLMRRVKEQFDPRRVLSPGRFVGGI